MLLLHSFHSLFCKLYNAPPNSLIIAALAYISPSITLFTMSKESESGSSVPESRYMRAFPLTEKAIEDSSAWLLYVTSHPSQNLKIETKRMQKTDPTLYAYLGQMYELRRQLQLSEEQLAQYPYGAIFGVNVLTNQFAQIGLTLPHANKMALATYFKSLITNHDNFKNLDMQYNILVATQPGMVKGPVTPSRLAEMYRKNPSNQLLLDIQERFNNNSSDALGRMWRSEPHLSTAVPDINNIIDEGRRGFFQGLLDVYAPFKMEHVVGPYVEILDQLEF